MSMEILDSHRGALDAVGEEGWVHTINLRGFHAAAIHWRCLKVFSDGFIGFIRKAKRRLISRLLAFDRLPSLLAKLI
jgi:hypothetical protein